MNRVEGVAPEVAPGPIFKVLLLGDGSVGKTVFLWRHRRGEFRREYVATLGVEVHPLVFNTQYGQITLNVWDCAGQERFGGLRDGYFIMGQAAIIMFDLLSRPTFDSINRWRTDFIRVCGDAPVCFVGNKADVNRRKVSPKAICKQLDSYGNQPLRNQRASAAATMTVLCLFDALKSDMARYVAQMVWHSRRHAIWNRPGDRRDPALQYYDLSAKSNYNFVQPFLWLARQLTGKDDLVFVEAPGLLPHPVVPDHALLAQFEEEMAEAQSMVLPDDNEDF